LRNLPVGKAASLQLSQVANVTEGTVLGEYDRYNLQRMLTLGADVVGEDLGRATEHVEQAVAGALKEMEQLEKPIRDAGGSPPKVNVNIRGQVQPMRELFDGLTSGLGV